MRKTKTLMSLLGGLGRFFRLTGRLPSITTITTSTKSLYYPVPSSDDGLGNISCLQTEKTIQVEEVDQVVFVQEWVRTVAESEGSAPATERGEGSQGVDRRLPNFDRRHPGNDRRTGYGHDRRGDAPTAGAAPLLIRGKRDRPKR